MWKLLVLLQTVAISAAGNCGPRGCNAGLDMVQASLFFVMFFCMCVYVFVNGSQHCF